MPTFSHLVLFLQLYIYAGVFICDGPLSDSQTTQDQWPVTN
jgi:hypothetical protein